MLFTSAALCIVLIAGLWGFSHIQKINSPAHQLSLGEKYLSEMKYEEAILAFNKVIEVDPANVEAYLGMAEAHIGLGDVEEAIRILQEAYDRLGDMRLKEKLDELQGELAAPQGSTWGNISFDNMKPEHQSLLYEFIRLFREDDAEQMLALLQEEEEAVRSIVERYMGIHLYVQVEDLKIGLMHMLINPGGSIEIREENGSVIYCYFNYHITEYDEAGLELQTVEYHADGTLYRSCIPTYGENGLLIRRDEISADGTLNSYYLYEYDENGNVVKESWFDEDGNTLPWTEYDYDSNGIQTEYRIYNADGSLQYREVTSYQG